MRVLIALVIVALMAPQYASSPSSEVMIDDVEAVSYTHLTLPTTD